MKLRTMTFLIALSFSSAAWAPAETLPPSVQRLTNIINAYPHPSPDGSRIVFQSNRTGTPQVFVMDADGTQVRQLTDNPLGAETPKWSPDGKLILFASYLGDDNNDLFVMSPDGSNQHQLTASPGYDGHASWSLDGSRIIFNSDRTSPDLGVSWSQRWHEIFSMRADGTDVRQHTNLQMICTYPSFSPDQEHITYRKVIASAAMSWDLTLGQRNSEIFVAAADGSEETNLTNSAAFDGWPVWSPDGTLIAFASNRVGPANVGQIFVIQPDGENLRQVSFGPWGYAQPAWSTDGTRIFAYQFQETPAVEVGDIVHIDLED
jgi:TolB protein